MRRNSGGTEKRMLRTQYPYYLASRPAAPNQDLEVTDKFTGEVITRVAVADEAAIETAIAKAVDAFEIMKRMTAYERQAVLRHCVRRIEERADKLAHVLTCEAGKPIRDSRGEVARLLDTFRIAAEEAPRLGGEVMDLEVSPRSRGYRGQWKRVPLGPCSFITPFNFPLNLAAHKIAPALAVGCPFILKPASKTPVSALLLGEILDETSLPEGAFSILPTSRAGATLFTTDDRLKLLSFTGSPAVGWDLKARAGKKKVVLELGGNAGCIVDETADQEDAISRLLMGAFSYAGQSCISVQRIFIHEKIYDSFVRKLTDATRKLKAGNPKEEDTFLGPLIGVEEAERLEQWLSEAQGMGAKILCGGKRQGAVLEATLIGGAPAEATICSHEAFGPVAALFRFKDFDDALAQVNQSRFGLQTGIFTRDLFRAMRAWDRLDVGGVIIGDVPSWRVDNMPYGGVKDSGIGREGVKFAMQDMTEIKMLVLRTPAEATR